MPEDRAATLRALTDERFRRTTPPPPPRARPVETWEEYRDRYQRAQQRLTEATRDGIHDSWWEGQVPHE